MQIFNKKVFKLIIFSFIAVISVSGCNAGNSSENVIKITSENSRNNEFIKNYSAMNKENFIREGILNYRAGNIEKAIEILQNFVKNYPTDSIGHLYLGKAYYENNEPAKSLYHIKQAFSLDNTLEKELAGPYIGKNIIGRTFVTNEIIPEKNIALKSKACFDNDTQTIYASIEIINAPVDTELEAEWVYEISKKEQVIVNSIIINIEGSKNIIVSLKKPQSSWPSGKYKLNLFVNGEKNINLTFYVF